MKYSRRAFIKTSAAGAMLGMSGRAYAAQVVNEVVGAAPPPLATAEDIRELALRAVDAARAAGAQYADVRFSHSRYLSIGISTIGMEPPSHIVHLAYGVRALVDGAWGFFAGQDMSGDAVTRVARRAAEQAKANRLSITSVTALAPTPPVPDGRWDTPIEIDPFSVPIDEQLDHIAAALAAATKVKATGIARVVCGFDWLRDERTFASTEGSLITQTLYRAMPRDGGAHATAQSRSDVFNYASANIDALEPAGKGYEIVREANLMETLPLAAEEAARMLTNKRVEVGRYDLVLDARAIATPLAETLGRALELDRALGLEANAQGTSFLAPPQDVLGKTQVAARLLTIRGDRSQPGSLGAVGWDDEGVKPEVFTLVKDGTVVDYQTTREMATRLDWWYRQQGVETRSHGCCVAGSAERIPMEHMPNLSMQPGGDEASFSDLIADTVRGIAISGVGGGSIDHQHLNGQFGAGTAQEIRNGKLVSYLRGMNFQFRSPDLWRSMDAIGGRGSYVLCGRSARKGQPVQATLHSIGAVPARFRQVNVINVGRG